MFLRSPSTAPDDPQCIQSFCKSKAVTKEDCEEFPDFFRFRRIPRRLQIEGCDQRRNFEDEHTDEYIEHNISQNSAWNEEQSHVLFVYAIPSTASPPIAVPEQVLHI